jgi:hypothetical protein
MAGVVFGTTSSPESELTSALTAWPDRMRKPKAEIK